MGLIEQGKKGPLWKVAYIKQAEFWEVPAMGRGFFFWAVESGRLRCFVMGEKGGFQIRCILWAHFGAGGCTGASAVATFFAFLVFFFDGP